MRTEVLAGRAGDDIASAVITILDKVLEDNPEISDLVTWCDSCVPQNRNQMICYSMLVLIKTHKQLNSVTMKYSIPGHSCVQVVDNMHSKMENAMSVAEFFSPVSYLNVLLNSHRQKPYNVTQTQDRHFKEYSHISGNFDYSVVPFSKVK